MLSPLAEVGLNEVVASICSVIFDHFMVNSSFKDFSAPQMQYVRILCCILALTCTLCSQIHH